MENEQLSDTDAVPEIKRRKRAWKDEADEDIKVRDALDAQGRKLPRGGFNARSIKYKRHLEHKFTTIHGTPKWAALDKIKNEDDSEDELLQSCGFIHKTIQTKLPQNILDFKKVRDLNCETYSEGPYVNSIEFHPTSSVALVAGNSGIASLFAVDGKRNKKLHSVAYERYPIICAKFIQGGNEVVLGSRQSHIFSFDLLAEKSVKIPLPSGITQFKHFIVSPNEKYLAVVGKWGEVHLMTAASKESIGILKQDSEVNALSYNFDGSLLFGHSDTGVVTVWDMNTRRVKHTFTDEGCVQGTAINLSPSNQFIATGSAQGVVNLYYIKDVLQSKMPRPQRTVLNLRTAINNLQFNEPSEVLALTSADIPNSVKLLHVGSGTVFNNFPQFGTKLGHINAMNFSPNSGFIAFGNRKSTVALYRLKHYKNY